MELVLADIDWDDLRIEALDRTVEAAIRAKIDGKAKPPGSLGRIEDIAAQLARMWHPQPPRADKAVLLVFAGDHGLTAEGVSQYPSAVTPAMVRTFLAGRASANAFATAAGVEIKVIDSGVAIDLPDHPNLTVAKVRHGTANAAREPAMTADEVKAALARGYRTASDAIDGGADVIAIGEMGIGNTASAALLMHRLAPAPLRDCVGAGAGQDEVGMARKLAALERAAARTAVTAPLDVLREFGGLEIAMMAGAIFGAAQRRRPVVVDGFIASAAALVAIRMQPVVQEYCVFAHRSAERGHGLLLASIDAVPLLELGMRLGEGTGAVLAIPILRAAARLLTDVADLQDVLAGKI
jgi:nicotinate-nucleotide--dimethylbenzimidazole phosphoribosyltransferase